ncbi:MAG: nicotinate (nicotinamide) nucleotide adenylyltransferase [Clostridiales bacterium]|jgi:nicotinate-nucleotide adenylyltransferase|nr:nicotinate (nicotinamide) nucleotide adenylyltransferase [Clostridiales bacterium]
MSTFQKTALFGGAFDPVHKGHTALAASVAEEFNLSEVVAVPAGGPPWKTASASAQDRLAMCRLAFQSVPHVTVSDFEIVSQQKPSYTYKTLEHFHTLLGYPPFFIVGADAVPGILDWKEPEQIAAHSTLIVAGRMPYDHALEGAIGEYRDKTGGKVLLSRAKAPDISSTEIRILHSFGEDLSAYLDPAVIEYVETRGLYMQYAAVARAIKNLVDGERYRHTASVATVAYKLAGRYGADPARAVRAALYHDCAKRITAEEAAQKFGLDVPREIFALHPKIRHAPIGALYAQKYFNETDADVLNAIRWHTTGRPDMSLLEKIIFVADYIDPLRAYDDTPLMYETAFRDLEKAMQCKYAEIEEQKKVEKCGRRRPSPELRIEN